MVGAAKSVLEWRVLLPRVFRFFLHELILPVCGGKIRECCCGELHLLQNFGNGFRLPRTVPHEAERVLLRS